MRIHWNGRAGFQLRRGLALAAIAIAIVTLNSAGLPAQQSTRVMNTADSGPGSLRQVLNDAGPLSIIDFDPVGVPAGSTITLTSGPITIRNQVLIIGPGADKLTISGNHTSRIFDLRATAEMWRLTLRDGYASDGLGGAIRMYGFRADIDDCVFINNTARAGDGSPGAKTGVPFDRYYGGAGGGGAAAGGAIFNYGFLDVRGTTFSGNFALGGDGGAAATGRLPGGGGAAFGGAIFSFHSSATINTSTFTGNRAVGGDGGVHVDEQQLPLGADGGAGGPGCCGVGTAGGNTPAGTGGAAGSGGAGGAAPFGAAGVAGFGGGAGSTGGSLANPGAAGSPGFGGGLTSLAGGNGGSGFGGAIFAASFNLTPQQPQSAVTTLESVTIAGNDAIGGAAPAQSGRGYGGGVASWDSVTVLRNTIVAANHADLVALGNQIVPFTAPFDTLRLGAQSLGHNLIGCRPAAHELWISDPTDLFSDCANPIDPRLEPLANNGGPTPTMRLLSGSPAIDRGANGNVAQYDQRGVGYARVVNGVADIGAYESGHLVLLTQPQSVAACGSSATFSVTTDGVGPLTYQWRRNGINLPINDARFTGVRSASLTINQLLGSDAGGYDVVVAGPFATLTSATATLTISSVPVITRHPADQYAAVGDTAIFTVEAAASGPVAVQWQGRASALEPFADIAGANALTLNVPVASAEAYTASYRAVVTTACGTAVTGSAAILPARTPSIMTLSSSQNPSGLGEPVSFTATIGPAGISEFARTDYETASYPAALAAGDFNRDGHADVAFVDYSAQHAGVRLGLGAGQFGPATYFSTGAELYPIDVAAADFNGDNILDLVIANQAGEGVSPSIALLLGDGHGGFSSPTQFVLNAHPWALALADFNRDNKMDVATSIADTTAIRVLYGNGAGGFGTPVLVRTGPATRIGNPRGIVAGDFNRDGRPDIATANFSDNSIGVVVAEGQGFSNPIFHPTGNRPNVLTMGDFNGDGSIDLVAGNYFESTVTVLLGDPQGEFQFNPKQYTAGYIPAGLATGDFNGDMKSDIAVSVESAGNVMVLAGNGLGGFAPGVTTAVGINPGDIVAADLDHRGLLDLVLVNQSEFSISVLTNESRSTAGGAVQFTIDGVNFGPAVPVVNGAAVSQSTSTLPAGTRAIAAEYLGDGAYAPSTATLNQVVARRPTTTTVTSDGNPSAPGAAVTFTASVRAGAGSSTPAGTVRFTRAGLLLGVVPLNAEGVASVSASNLPGGTSTITAAFPGSATFEPSTGTFDQSVDGIAAGISVTSAPNPSVFGQPVVLTATVTPAPAVSFTLPAEYQVATNGNNPLAMATGDFNRDGRLDVAVVPLYSSGSRLVIRMGNDTGGFDAAVEYPAPGVVRALTRGDFNGDGVMDIAAAGDVSSQGKLTIYLGDGSGQFVQSTQHTIARLPVQVIAGDLNEDGKDDIATVHVFSPPAINFFTLLTTTPSGGFTVTTPTFQGHPGAAAMGRFTADQHLDLATLVGGNLILLPGDGGGAFGVPIQSGFVGGAAIHAADFNADGALDLAMPDDDSAVRVVFGNGNGAFGSLLVLNPVVNGFRFFNSPISVASGDLNGDGALDMAVANRGGQDIGVLLGNGTGGFTIGGKFSARTDETGWSPNFVVVTDQDADGRPDLLVNNSNRASFSVLSNWSTGANGTVQFRVDGSDAGAPVLLLNGVAVSPPMSSLAAGARSITAVYAGDRFFKTTESEPLTQTVNKADVGVVVTAPANPAYGTNVTLSARVTPAPPGSGTPSGSVEFFDNGISMGTSSMTNGVASVTTSTLAAGPHTIRAEYGGDGAKFNPGNGSTTTTAVAAGTTTSLAGPASGFVSQRLQFVATVRASQGVATPTGRVQFKLDDIVVGPPVPITASGQATAMIAAAWAGFHNVTAAYLPENGNFSGSDSPWATYQVQMAPTAIGLSVTPSQAVYGQTVRLAATVSVTVPDAEPVTGGSVTFLRNGFFIGSAAVSNGIAVFDFGAGNLGTLSITAYYSEFVNYGSSQSEPVALQVAAADTITEVTSSLLPSVYGQSVTFTITVRAAASLVTPSGYVQLKHNGAPVGQRIYAPLGTATVVIPVLPGGERSITAEYTPDSGFNVSIGMLTQTVNKAPLTIRPRDVTWVYGMPQPAFEADYAGFVNGETLATSGITGMPVIGSAATPTSPASIYAMFATPGTLASANYSFVLVEGTLTRINPLPAIDHLTPNSVVKIDEPGAEDDLVLSVHGTNFVPQSAVAWNGEGLSTTFRTSELLEVNVAPARLAEVGVAYVTVSSHSVNGAGGGTSNAKEVFITAAPAPVIAADTVIVANSTESVSVGGTGEQTPGSLTATATGTGAVTIAQYQNNPGPAVVFAAAGSYFDTFVPPTSTLTTLEIVNCNLNGGNQIYWYDPAPQPPAVAGWFLVTPQTYNAAAGCMTMTLDNVSSAPRIDQLDGTFFAVARDVTAPSTLASAATGAGAYSFGTWANAPVTVTLAAADNAGGAGVAALSYSVAGGSPQSDADGLVTFDINSDGETTVAFAAADAAGNVEAQQTRVVKIDRGAPSVLAVALPGNIWPANGKLVPVLIVGWMGDDRAGIRAASYHVTDEYGQTQPTGAVTVRAGGLYLFTVMLPATRHNNDKDGRRFTIRVDAVDYAGNTGGATTEVRVKK